MKKVYFDNNATTPLHEELKSSLAQWLDLWGNPSSVHWAGQSIKGKIREARQAIAKFLNVSPLEIIFTSGGSESNSTVVKSILDVIADSRSKSPDINKNEFITTTVEHPSLKKAFESIESQGYKVHRIGFSPEGEFDFSAFDKVLCERTALVSVMSVNNETGLILPLKEISAKSKKVGALVHTDAVQAFGKMNLNLQDLGVDYASFSGHKFYALKGAGILYAKKSAPLSPLIFGGGQERHRRGGTENSLGILSMGFMAQKFLETESFLTETNHVKQLRDYFENRVLAEIDRVHVNHHSQERVGGTSSLILRDVEGEALLMALDVKGFAVSTGSACSSGSSLPSASLQAFGLSPSEARSTLRVSFGWFNTFEEIDLFLSELKTVTTRLRKLVTSRKGELFPPQEQQIKVEL